MSTSALPTMATIHIQKIAPGPPSTIAIATPAMFPTPTRLAVLTQNAWNEDICPAPRFPTPSTSTRNISPRYRICTNPVRIVK